MNGECNAEVTVSDVISRTEAEQTAANLAGLKVRIGNFNVTDTKIVTSKEYDNGEGQKRWTATAFAAGERM